MGDKSKFELIEKMWSKAFEMLEKMWDKTLRLTRRVPIHQLFATAVIGLILISLMAFVLITGFSINKLSPKWSTLVIISFLVTALLIFWFSRKGPSTPKEDLKAWYKESQNEQINKEERKILRDINSAMVKFIQEANHFHSPKKIGAKELKKVVNLYDEFNRVVRISTVDIDEELMNELENVFDGFVNLLGYIESMSNYEPDTVGEAYKDCIPDFNPHIKAQAMITERLKKLKKKK